jgi:putative ABC transport system substrate-binding protein
LRELGYAEGQNISLEARVANGNNERLPSLAGELLNLGVDVVVTDGFPAAAAARDATQALPIIMAIIPDPVGSGLVANLGRPGGNMTGFNPLPPGLYTKRLQLLKEALARVSRVAVLHELGAFPDTIASDIQAAGSAMGLELVHFEIRTPDDLDGVFQAASTAQAEGLLNAGGPIVANARGRVAALAAEYRLPGMFSDGGYAVEGGLLAYGPDIPDLVRRSASYVDRVLKGARPGDLPIQQPTKFDFVVNLRTAQELGLTIPPSVLAQATEVLQ